MLLNHLFDSRILRLSLILFCLFSLSSCSWFSTKESLFGDEGQQTVPKEEFDRLLQKYEALKKHKTLEEASINASQEMTDLNAIEKDSEEIVRRLKRVNSNNRPPREATVSPIASTPRAKQPRAQRPSITQSSQAPIEIKAQVRSSDYPSELVEEHIKKVRQAESFVVQNKFSEALKLIKELEVSPVRQISVRAKFLLGETFFRQGEYDLAMQVYEEILKKHSFSGLVIKSLGRLIVCSEKLNIPQKKEKYYSILHDFFEQG